MKCHFIHIHLRSQSFFGFGQTADIAISLSDAEKRKMTDLKTEDGGKIKAHLFYDGEDVGGTVSHGSKKKLYFSVKVP